MAPGLPPLPKTLSEFSDPKYWDAFFKARGGRPFEWYGDWKLISKLLTAKCELKANNSEQKILIPGCGNSTLSEDMYDAGFSNITNIDFSRVVIAEMLRLHVRSRPRMRWLVMDMTKMQLPDDSYDVVVDKGGLDALLGEPEDDRSSGVSFLSEVKRVLKVAGRFACITLAQQHVIELLLHTFRDGWQLRIHGLQLSAGDSPSSLEPFLVIAKHEGGENLPQVSFDLDMDWRGTSNMFQMEAVVEAVDTENVLRSKGLATSEISEDLEHSPQNIYDKLHPGRRLTTKLVSQDARFTFTCIILDAKEDIELAYQCAVFLVPKGRAHEWLFSSAEGQWELTESAKAGRLILVSLDPNVHSDDIIEVKDDLSPLLKPLFSLESRDSGTVPYMTQGDGVASRNVLAEVDSPITGPMVVEDVHLSDEKPDSNKPKGAKLDLFRRLVFKRNPNLIQSEALLVREKGGTAETSGKHSTGKKKRKLPKEVSPATNPGTFEQLKVDHSYLVSPYHAGMMASFALIARSFKLWLASKEEIRLMLVGLGAGSLPMFVHNHFPINSIQIVELDPAVGDVAKLHFGFTEDDRMKLHVGDGLVAVQSIASKASLSNVQRGLEDNSDHQNKEEGSTDISLDSIKDFDMLGIEDDDTRNLTNGDNNVDSRLHVLIIDADSTDVSSGLSCPPADFLKDAFLLAARAALVDSGMLIINVVSRARSHHVQAVSQLKKFFEEVYDIEVNEDLNRVLVALPRARNSLRSSNIMNDLSVLEDIARKFAPWGNGPKLRDILKDLKRLK
ncbi:unnamed protein product [Calypogeia fissa]